MAFNSPSKRAVFLDRDGVLNRNVFYPDTGAWETPRLPHEFHLANGVIPALASLHSAGFLLFLVSNQPNAAKGKSPADALEAMHTLLTAELQAAGLAFAGVFYCTHHPEFTGPCPCRKPSPYFLLGAAQKHGLALEKCWMIGDRPTDMECGRTAGVHTAWICTRQERKVPPAALIDVASFNLPEAVRQILARTK